MSKPGDRHPWKKGTNGNTRLSTGVRGTLENGRKDFGGSSFNNAEQKRISEKKLKGWRGNDLNTGKKVVIPPGQLFKFALTHDGGGKKGQGTHGRNRRKKEPQRRRVKMIRGGRPPKKMW